MPLFVDGLNGIMIDVIGPADAESISASDFQFRVGNSNNLTDWSMPASPAVSVRQGDGQAGSDRITLTWEEHEIRNQWFYQQTADRQQSGEHY